MSRVRNKWHAVDYAVVLLSRANERQYERPEFPLCRSWISSRWNTIATFMLHGHHPDVSQSRTLTIGGSPHLRRNPSWEEKSSLAVSPRIKSQDQFLSVKQVCLLSYDCDCGYLSRHADKITDALTYLQGWKIFDWLISQLSTTHPFSYWSLKILLWGWEEDTPRRSKNVRKTKQSNKAISYDGNLSCNRVKKYSRKKFNMFLVLISLLRETSYCIPSR